MTFERARHLPKSGSARTRWLSPSPVGSVCADVCFSRHHGINWPPILMREQMLPLPWGPIRKVHRKAYGPGKVGWYLSSEFIGVALHLCRRTSILFRVRRVISFSLCLCFSVSHSGTGLIGKSVRLSGHRLPYDILEMFLSSHTPTLFPCVCVCVCVLVCVLDRCVSEGFMFHQW